MSVPELIRLVHHDTLEYLKSEEPLKVRKYLMDMGDDSALRAWDSEQMKSKQTRA